MKIVDGQGHMWSSGVRPPSGLHRKVSKLTPEEMLKEMDEAGVAAALLHPPGSWDPIANAYAVEAAKKYPDRFAVLGQCPPNVPEHRKRIHVAPNHPGMMRLRSPLLP